MEITLLGHEVFEKLGLIKQIYEVNNPNIEEIELKYPKLFKDLVNTEAYIIKIKQNAQPFVLSRPRQVPIPLMNKVELELQAMEKKQVIVPVIEPTHWCDPMVVMPKP